MTKGPNTYLNGLDIEPRCGACGRPPHDQCDDCAMYGDVLGLTPVEPPRPRFLTAWMVDDDEAFYPTGDAFLTLEDANAFAVAKLKENAQQDQMAVFEIRSVHLARVLVTSEEA